MTIVKNDDFHDNDDIIDGLVVQSPAFVLLHNYLKFSQVPAHHLHNCYQRLHLL